MGLPERFGRSLSKPSLFLGGEVKKKGGLRQAQAEPGGELVEFPIAPA